MYFTFFKKKLHNFQRVKGYPISDKDVNADNAGLAMDETMFAKAERMFYCYYQFLMDSEITTKIKPLENVPDSEDEYVQVNSNYLNDKIKGNPNIQSKLIVLDYFKFFLSLNDQISQPEARNDFLKKINGVIDETQHEIDMMQHKRPAEGQGVFPLEHQVFDEWLEDSVVSLYVNEDTKYVDSFASMTEYLVNPAIKKKNYLILKELADNYIPHLEKFPQYFSTIKDAALCNQNNCYDMKPITSSITKKSELKKYSDAKRFFDEQATMCQSQQVIVHQRGFKGEKLTALETKFHKNNINMRRYSEVPYLSKVRIQDLPGGMVSLDQLPKF